MKKILLSTAMLLSVSALAQAQSLPSVAGSLGGVINTNTGTEYTNVGTQSQAELSSNGTGFSSVVVTNNGLDVLLSPYANALSTADLTDTGAETGGDITISNERSVDVSGALAGAGAVSGMGMSETTFDASLLSGAKSTNNLTISPDSVDNSLKQSYDVQGLAQISGDSASGAAFGLSSADSHFAGTAGTNVGGGFDVSTGYYQGSYFGDFMGGSYYSDLGSGADIVIMPTDIDLGIMNDGHGLIELTGASSDLFSGQTLSSTTSSVKLSVDGVLGADLICGSLLDGLPGVCTQ